MRSGRRTRLKIAIWGSSLPAVLAASFLYYPWAFSGPTICPMPLVTGMPCPGCGLTRSLALLTHGHVEEAIAFQPLLPFLLLYGAFLCGYKVIELARGRPPRLPNEKIAIVAFWIVLGFWAARIVVFFAHGGLEIVARDNLLSRLARLLS